MSRELGRNSERVKTSLVLKVIEQFPMLIGESVQSWYFCFGVSRFGYGIEYVLLEIFFLLTQVQYCLALQVRNGLIIV